MAGRDIRAGGAFVEFSLRRKNLEKGLREVAQRISQTGAKINEIGTRLSAIGAGITAPFAAAVTVFGRVGGSLEKLSTQTGIAFAELSKIKSAGQLAGVSFDDLGGAIEELQIRLGEAAQDGTGPLAEAFQKLGLDAKELSETPLPERLGLIADKLNSLPNASDRQFLADEIFGGDATKIAPLLAEGSKGIQRYIAEVERLGVAIGPEAGENAKRLNKAIKALTLQVTAAAVAVGNALAPALTAIADSFTTVGRQVIDFLKANKGLVIAVASAGAGILALGGTLVGLGTAVGLAGFAVSSLAGLLAALTSPIALVIGGVVALGAVLVKFTDTGGQALDFLRDKFGQLLETATQAFSGVRKAIEAGDIELAAKILWTGLQLIFFEGTQELIKKGIELKAGILRAITEMTVGAIALGSELYARLQKTWANITAGAKAIWTNLKGDVTETFNLIRLQASKAGSAIREALDPEFNAERANRAAEKLFVDRQKEAQDERKKAIAVIEKEQQERLKQINEEAEARKSAIAEARDAELAAIDAGKKAEADRLRERIENLKKEQAQLLKNADAVSRTVLPENALDDKKESDPGAGGFRAREIARVAGITSSFNIRSLDNTSQSEAKRLRQVNEQQLQVLKRLERKQVKAGGRGVVVN